MYIDGPITFSYIWRTFTAYIANNPVLQVLFILYLLALIYLFINRIKRDFILFVLPFLIFMATVFNPLFMIRIINLLHIDERYYRYFWMLPLTITLAYVYIKILSGMKHFVSLIIIYISLIVVIIAGKSRIRYINDLVASGIFGNEMFNVTNVYKLNDDYVDIADLIAKDKADDKVVSVMCGLPVSYFLTTYDASQVLFYPREVAENYYLVAPQEAAISAMAEDRYYDAIFYVFNAGSELSDDLLHEALVNGGGGDYLVFPKSFYGRTERFIHAGCTLIGSTDNYYVLRWEN